MEQHPLPPAADSPPLCSSAPLRQQYFPQQLRFLFVAFCCGHWEKSKCVLHGWTLEIVEKITPHKATLCQLLLHLALFGWGNSLTLLQRGICLCDSCQFCGVCKTFIPISGRRKCCLLFQWVKKKAEMYPQKLPCSYQSPCLNFQTT